MPPTSCPHCRSTRLKDARMTSGTHHAKRSCLDCGRFVAWLPKPEGDVGREVPGHLVPYLSRRDRPVSLRGTPGQVSLARGHRAVLIAHANKDEAPVEFVRLLCSVEDATWFLANAGRRYPHLKCWPRADQMAKAEAGAETR